MKCLGKSIIRIEMNASIKGKILTELHLPGIPT